VLEDQGEEVQHREEAGDAHSEPLVIHGMSQGQKAPPRGPPMVREAFFSSTILNEIVV
jgi:hypothetical protein